MRTRGVRQSVDVAKLLDRLGIQGERRGEWITARCPSPAHEDRNPSWRIKISTGSHKCFSCGFSGTTVGLVMAVCDLDVGKAIEWLGSEELAAPQDLELMIELKVPRVRSEFRLPSGVVIAPLAAWPTPARDYASSRKVTADQVDRWGLGYAVDGRLAGRIVFPVRDATGRLISYTARTFIGHRKRYLEPALAEDAVEGAVFGEHHARSNTILVVTEGALDALAVERAAASATITSWSPVAIYGSGVLPSHLNRLSGKYLGIVIATDPDPAGDRAALEIHNGLARWMRVRRWRPPEGEDCGSLSQKGQGSVIFDGIVGAWFDDAVVRPALQA
jgi:DNA primase